MKTILLIGATGFIGKRVMKHLLTYNDDYRILTLTRSEHRLKHMISQYNIPYYPHHSRKMNSILPLVGKLDLPQFGLSVSDLELAKSAEVLIHVGGTLQLQQNQDEADLMLQSTRQVITTIKTELCNLRHVIYVGGPISCSSLVQCERSNQASALVLPYERAKLREETELRAACSQHDIALSVVLPGVVYGDAQTGVNEQLNGLGLFVHAMRRGWLGTLPSRAAQWLPLVSVDAVAAYIRALASEAAPRSGTYPLLDPMGQQLTVKQLTQRIARELHLPAQAPLRQVPGKLVQHLAHKLRFTSRRDRPSLRTAAMRLLLDQPVDLSATLALKAKYSVPCFYNEAVFSAVIADIDYRISHQHGKLVVVPSRTEDGALDRPPDLPLVRQDVSAAHTYLTGYERHDLPLQYRRRGQLASWEVPGNNNRPPIVFLHGLWSSSDFLLPLAPYLRKSTLWFLDLPGFGRSPSIKDEPFLENTIQAVIEAIKTANQPVILAGHSIGGWIAYQIMSGAPELIKHLLLLQPVFQAPTHLFCSKHLNKLILKYMTPKLYMNMLVNMNCYEHKYQIPHDLIRLVTREIRSPRVRAITAYWMKLFSNNHSIGKPADISAYAERISILWGYHDKGFSLPADILPHHVTRVPSGHYLPISHPIETATWIQARLEIYVDAQYEPSVPVLPDHQKDIV